MFAQICNTKLSSKKSRQVERSNFKKKKILNLLKNEVCCLLFHDTVFIIFTQYQLSKQLVVLHKIIVTATWSLISTKSNHVIFGSTNCKHMNYQDTKYAFWWLCKKELYVSIWDYTSSFINFKKPIAKKFWKER